MEGFMEEVVEKCGNDGEEGDEQEELDETPELNVLRCSPFRWFANILINKIFGNIIYLDIT